MRRPDARHGCWFTSSDAISPTCLLRTPPIANRTPQRAERDLIRHGLCVRSGCPPALAEGIFLRVWRSGPSAGQPKVPVAIQSMVDRGLMMVHARSPHIGPRPLHGCRSGGAVLPGGAAPRVRPGAVRLYLAGAGDGGGAGEGVANQSGLTSEQLRALLASARRRGWGHRRISLQLNGTLPMRIHSIRD